MLARIARPWFAVATLMLCSGVGCAAPTRETARTVTVAPEIDVPFGLTIDELDVRHGALRIAATMDEGSADVTMVLGESCKPTREVGRGIATPREFVWSLTSDELARAVECGLIVYVRGVDEEGHRVRRVAELPVSTSLVPRDSEGPSLVAQSMDDGQTLLAFETPSRAMRLHVGPALFGAIEDEDEEEDDPTHAKFLVPNEDLTQAVVARRELTLLGARFAATVTVGNATLDVETTEQEPGSGVTTVDEGE